MSYSSSGTHLVVKLGGVLENTTDNGVLGRGHEALSSLGNDLDGVGVDVNHV